VLLLLIYVVFRIYEPFLGALGWAAILVIFFYLDAPPDPAAFLRD